MKKFLLGFIIMMSLGKAYASEQKITKFEACTCVGDESRRGYQIKGFNLIKAASGETSVQSISLGFFFGHLYMDHNYRACKDSLYPLIQAGVCPDSNAPKKDDSFWSIF